jgi:Domain of Unknown Function (DUF1206)
MQLSLKRPTEKNARRVRRKANREAKKASASPGFQLAERFGYAVRGVLYGSMGVLALGVATSSGGRLVDQSGSLSLVASAPFGRIVVAAFVVGIGAYSAWGFIRAVYDPLHRGRGTRGLANRLGWAWSGTSYGLLAIFALRLAVAGPHAPGDAVTGVATWLFGLPGGRLLTLAAGAAAIGAGIAQFVDAYQAGWHRDLKRGQMSDVERTAALWLGRAGLAARGVTFSAMGCLLGLAGWTADPDVAGGYAGAFHFLQSGPGGRLLLALVALGFVALGLHSLACARWIRLAVA